MKEKSVTGGLIAGALGGALGTVVLNVYQKASLEGTRALEPQPNKVGSVTKQQESLLNSFEQAHTRTAVEAASALGHPLSARQIEGAAPVVEFAFGILCAAVYGALAEYVPAATAGFGSLYGAVLFTGASEWVLPAMGYVAQPGERTAVQHAGGLSGNVVYGMCTEGVRRLLRG